MMDGFVDYAHDEYNCGDNDLDDDDYHCDDNDHEEDKPILERGRTDGGLRCLSICNLQSVDNHDWWIC